MRTPSSFKPYLIRAKYEWIVDNELTPHIIVDANYPGVEVPEAYVKDGKIILSIAPQACRGFNMDLDRIVFTARFNGKTEQIFIPPAAVLGIYVKETGQGTEFPPEEYEPKALEEKPKSPGKKPFLRLIEKE